MAIRDCSTCGRPFWAYQSGVLPPRYCTVVCWEKRPRRDESRAERETWHEILAELRAHFTRVHRSTNITDWFDCATCRMIEARYNEATVL